MGKIYRVNLTFAPAGGSRLRQGETVEIDDADVAPYQTALDRGWLTLDSPARLGVMIPPPLDPQGAADSVAVSVEEQISGGKAGLDAAPAGDA